LNQPFEPAQYASAEARRARIRVCWNHLAAPQVWLRASAALILCLALGGCRHKTLWVPPASVTAPVELEELPPPENQPVIAEIPPPQIVPVQPPLPPRRAPKKKPVPAPKEAQTAPPTQVASAAEPAALAIGSLTTGGDSVPQTQQQARDLIGAIEKRIADLPRNVASQQKSQLRQVNRFLKQAQQALDAGDAEGAVTLATKARLIMDDIEKK
jgi:hypothetical protein